MIFVTGKHLWVGSLESEEHTAFSIVVFDLYVLSVVFFCYVFPVSHFTMSCLWKRGNKQLAKGKSFHIAVTGQAASASRAGPLLLFRSPVVSVETGSLHIFTLQRHVVFIKYAVGAQSPFIIPILITKKNLLSAQDLHSCTSRFSLTALIGTTLEK